MVRWSIMYLSDDTVILGGSEGGSVCVCVCVCGGGRETNPNPRRVQQKMNMKRAFQ